MTLENIFIWILNMSLTGSLMILAVLLMRLFLKRAPKIFSYMLWLIVLFRLICPISFESEFSLLNILGVSSEGNGTVDFISESIGTEGPSGVESLFGNLNMNSESAGADDEIRAEVQEDNAYGNNRYGYAGQGGTTSEDGRQQGISQSETTNPNMIQQETDQNEAMQPDAAAYEDADRQGNMQQIDAQKSSDTDNIESLRIWGILGALYSSQLQSVFSVGSIVWIIGVGALMLYGFGSYMHLNRKLYRLESNELEAKESDSKGIELNEPVAGDISAIKGRIRIYRCNDIPTAFVLGLFRPRIYLPANLEETEERYILLHEQVHIKRGDSLYRTIAYLALCLHWFNPLAWLAFYLSGMDMEMSCDEAVIRQIGSGIKKEYSQTLLALATGSSMVKGIPLAFGEGDTGSRIKNVLGYKKPTVILIAAALILCLGGAVFLLGNPLNHMTEDNGEISVSGNDADEPIETNLPEEEENESVISDDPYIYDPRQTPVFFEEDEQYFPLFEGEWVAVEHVGSINDRLPPEEYTDEYYERQEAWKNAVKEEFLGSEYRIVLDNIGSFRPTSEMGYILESDTDLMNITHFAHHGLPMTPPYITASVHLWDTDEYYALILDDDGTLLINIMNNYFRLERKSETDFVAGNEENSIYHFGGEEYFPLFQGKWTVSEYICNVYIYGMQYNQEYIDEIIEEYLGSELNVGVGNIDYFGPISNTNFEMHDLLGWGWFSRDDIESLGLSSPYTGVKVHLTDRDKWFRFIIDSDGNLIVKIDDCFFRLEEEQEPIYYEDNIVNFQDAFDTYWDNFYDVPREITVGEYSDIFPVELQDALIYCNDGIQDERDDYYKDYAANLEGITLENAGDIPYDEIMNAADGGGIKSFPIYAFDIDGDGEDEYLVHTEAGTVYGLNVIKFFEGRWRLIGGNNPQFTDACQEILYYGDRYYLLSGNYLIGWNDEAEMPDVSYWRMDDIVGHDPCWNELVVFNRITDYTPYEMYNNMQNNTNDYLENINWTTLKDEDAEEITFESGYLSVWNIGYSLDLSYGWERTYDGEKYLYVIARSHHGRTVGRAGDRILTILRRTEDGAGEIVKIYYVAANYDIQLNLREN